LDVLDTFPTLNIVTGYLHPVAGEPLERLPADLELLGRVKIQYEELKGCEKTTTGAKTFLDLPREAMAYIEFIEKFIKGAIYWDGSWPGEYDYEMKT